MMLTSTLSRGARRIALVASLGLAACAPSPPAEAPTPALPAAEQLLARHIEAVGGEEAILRHSSVRSTGTISMPAMGMEAKVEVLGAKPDLYRMEMVIPGVGSVQQGYTGEVGWSVNPMVGAALAEGEELEQLRQQAEFFAQLTGVSVPGEYASMETLGRAEYGGEPCWEAKLVHRSGGETTACFDVETGLLVARVHRQETPMGPVETRMLLSDYRDFDGVRVASRAEVSVMGQEQVITTDTLEFGVVDAAAFEPPAEIRALISQQ